MICSHLCLIGQLVCVSGLRDGGAADSGVGGGESRWVSEKQRPHGSFDPVCPWSFCLFEPALLCLQAEAIYPTFICSQDVLARLCDQRQTDEPKEHRPAQLPRPGVCRPVIAAPPAVLLSSQEVWRVWPPPEWPAPQCDSGTHTGKTKTILLTELSNIKHVS